MNKKLEELVIKNQSNGWFISSREFFEAASFETQTIIGGLNKLQLMVESLNGEISVYANHRQQQEAALLNADRRAAYVELRVRENKVCRQILWLNQLHKQLCRTPFLQRLYDFESVKISSKNNPEAEAMIVAFLKAAGYSTDNYDFQVK